MNSVLAWLKGPRVFPRWELIAMVVTGMLSGLLIGLEEYAIAIFALLSLLELSKRASD